MTHADTHPLEYNQIDSHIYIGTNQCCQSHFAEELLKKGISADVSLEEDRVDAPFGVESYLWLPVKDHTSPVPDQLRIGVATLRELASLDKKVYVHCKNGHGRAPTLVSAYYIAQGMSVQDAIRFVCEKRLGAHLEESQKRALALFAREA